MGGWKQTGLGVLLLLLGCGGDGVDFEETTTPGASGGFREPRMGQSVRYSEAPPVPGFPLPEATLDGFLARGDEAAMRSHAWSLWSSLTGSTPSGLPVMLTWFTNAEIFGEGKVANSREFRPRILAGPADNFGNGDPPTEVNFYNRAYRSHVRRAGYEWRDSLNFLVRQGATNVLDFPTDTIVAKTVWWPVRHDGLTAFPVWDDQPTRPIEWGTGVDDLVDDGHFGPLSPEEQAELKSHLRHGNEWGTFARVVAVDPTSERTGETVTVPFFDTADPDYGTLAERPARVVPLENFFTFRLTDQATVDSLNAGVMGQMTRKFWGRGLTQQDSLALVAVHLTTRETRNWVWATYWWHDGEPQPDRPANLGSPFNHFRMGVTQSADIPVAQEDGGPNVTFNPYLEAGFAEGTRSNCMGCHQRAGWTANGPQSVMPVHRGTIPAEDPQLDGVLRTHFMWSLVFRPRPRGVGTPVLPGGDFVPEP